MKLTDKAKVDFEKWLIKQKLSTHVLRTDYNWNDIGFHNGMTLIELLPQSMKYGVYVDWFDSVGVDIDVFRSNASDKLFYWNVEGEISQPLKTRQEARTEAIRKANEIYNLNNK